MYYDQNKIVIIAVINTGSLFDLIVWDIYDLSNSLVITNGD